ncbi:MAG: hypothetical protein AVDCRST_MAG41-2649, partial [uncultured Corynebacteriales bacterium]
ADLHRAGRPAAHPSPPATAAPRRRRGRQPDGLRRPARGGHPGDHQLAGRVRAEARSRGRRLPGLRGAPAGRLPAGRPRDRVVGRYERPVHHDRQRGPRDRPGRAAGHRRLRLPGRAVRLDRVHRPARADPAHPGRERHRRDLGRRERRPRARPATRVRRRAGRGGEREPGLEVDRHQDRRRCALRAGRARRHLGLPRLLPRGRHVLRLLERLLRHPGVEPGRTGDARPDRRPAEVLRGAGRGIRRRPPHPERGDGTGSQHGDPEGHALRRQRAEGGAGQGLGLDAPVRAERPGSRRRHLLRLRQLGPQQPVHRRPVRSAHLRPVHQHRRPLHL